MKGWSEEWGKAVPKKPRVYKPRAEAKQSGAHTSVHRVLEETRRLKKLKKTIPHTE